MLLMELTSLLPAVSSFIFLYFTVTLYCLLSSRVEAKICLEVDASEGKGGEEFVSAESAAVA